MIFINQRCCWDRKTAGYFEGINSFLASGDLLSETCRLLIPLQTVWTQICCQTVYDLDHFVGPEQLRTHKMILNHLNCIAEFLEKISFGKKIG